MQVVATSPEYVSTTQSVQKDEAFILENVPPVQEMLRAAPPATQASIHWQVQRAWTAQSASILRLWSLL